MERVHKKLHDLILEARNELHTIDGTVAADYVEFKSKLLGEAAALIHKAYALAVTHTENVNKS